ncbi:alpha/beta-Hydrolases superfamily protein [Rhynchospora pubera]|uniref:Alpha/beta-Hydrolases superfamily protein n=1 Tax=Rhynchospora pubera TaxID=906938 RepID=A0AAV8EMS3_9POAL|nr:alpha/beta-Hydrolases superfamily protein [Rhynchospora pubera]
MVNLVEIQKPILHWLVKGAGLREQLIEIEPGTFMNFWAPKDVVQSKPNTVNPTSPDVKRKKSKKPKPPLVLIHGFASEGIITWQFQFGVLLTNYAVYIPDLLFFGKSTTPSLDRSPDFQASCIARGLRKLGVEQCDAVGFSYGGMVAFKLAEAYPDLVRSLVISGSVITMTDSINETSLKRLGATSSAELLMPETVPRLKDLLSISMHKKLWFPDRLYKDFLESMFKNRKERKELLEGLVISNMDAKIPVFQQKILLLWGEKDQIFDIDLAKKMKEQLGDNCYIQGISNAGHLLHLERPCAYNRAVQRFLAYVNSTEDTGSINV